MTNTKENLDLRSFVDSLTEEQKQRLRVFIADREAGKERKK